MQRTFDIVVVGCGVSAGFLLRFLDGMLPGGRYTVLVLDRNRQPFRKLLATGNGRCNFSNERIARSDYFTTSASREWVTCVVHDLAAFNLRQYLYEQGIPSIADEYGRLFPLTNSARTIEHWMQGSLRRPLTRLESGCTVTALEACPEGFTVAWRGGDGAGEYRATARRAVFAAGGAAYPQLGTDGTAFTLLERLGHRVVPPSPGIVALETPVAALHACAGVKVQVEMTVAGTRVRRTGELLFTEYGISGPNTLYLSNHIAQMLRGGTSVSVFINFLPLPELTLEYFRGVARHVQHRTVSDVFGGALNIRLAETLASIISCGSVTPATRLAENNVNFLYEHLQHFELKITRTRPFDEAQVSLGGIACDQINPVTFESRLHHDLYCIGECVDFTGGCGGYNIHFAAFGARQAASAIARILTAAR